MKQDELKKLLETAKSLRDDHPDEIPAEEVHGTVVYKAQVNWFNNITTTMAVLIRREVIQDTDMIDAYHSFCDYLRLTDLGGRPTNEEDIRRGNEFLSLVIKYAERKTME